MKKSIWILIVGLILVIGIAGFGIYLESWGIVELLYFVGIPFLTIVIAYSVVKMIEK